MKRISKKQFKSSRRIASKSGKGIRQQLQKSGYQGNDYYGLQW